MLTLWDLLKSDDRRGRQRARRRRPAGEPTAPPAPAAPRAKGPTMRERYEQMTRRMLATHEVRVRKWRTSMSGVAWQVVYRDGTVSRLIEAPRPKGPMSAAIFLHEVGHHAIGFGVHKPRCLEEYRAWAFALDQMRAHGLNVTPAVEKRMSESLQYAVWKARRRGIKRIPAELLPYLDGASAPTTDEAV